MLNFWPEDMVLTSNWIGESNWGTGDTPFVGYMDSFFILPVTVGYWEARALYLVRYVHVCMCMYITCICMYVCMYVWIAFLYYLLQWGIGRRVHCIW